MEVEFVKRFDPFDLKKSIDVISEATKWVKEKRKPAVIVAKRACALDVLDKINGDLPIAVVNEKKCTGCSICYDFFTCPAITVGDNKKAVIDTSLCIGCGACIPVCPHNAITLKGETPKGWDELWLS